VVVTTPCSSARARRVIQTTRVSESSLQMVEVTMLEKSLVKPLIAT
jgi:hypothetical protein